MPPTDDVLRGVQAAVAEVLGIEVDAVPLAARFLVDLADDESIELLDLQFKLDKRFGVRLKNGNFENAETDDQGRFTARGLESLRSFLPSPLLDRCQSPASAPTGRELWRAMTVEDIACMVQMALEATAKGHAA